jgi:hypothetical protein
MKIEEHSTAFWQLCSTPSFRIFEKHPPRIFVSFPIQTKDMGVSRDFKTLIRAELENCIL